VGAALAVRAALAVVLVAALTFVAAAPGQGIEVDFSYSPAAPTAGEPVTLTSTSSLQRPIVREAWDFDGDGRLDASGRSVKHTFVSPGTYTVTLIVQNDRGRVRSSSKSVTVSSTTPPPPPAPPAPTAPPLPPPVPAPTTPSGTTAPAAPAPIAPFPVVRITGSYLTLGVRLRLFAVTAPAGVRLTVRCRGRGCPYRERGPSVVRASDARPVGGARYVRIPGFGGRLLKPGVRLQVYVAHQDRIGKYTSFRVRRGHPPLRADGCLRPASASVFGCG
jgi:plastocyanin